MFNTLAVVGIAGAIKPITLEPLVLSRDWIAMAVLTLLLMAFSIRKARQGRINRVHGAIFIALYIVYCTCLKLVLLTLVSTVSTTQKLLQIVRI